MCCDILCFLVSFSHCSYFPIISFFAKITNRRDGAGPASDDEKLFVPSSSDRGATGMCSDILCFLVSSSHCSYFPIISFFAKITNRRDGAGPDRTDAAGKQNGSKTGGGKGYVPSCLFSQFISSSHSSSVPIA